MSNSNISADSKAITDKDVINTLIKISSLITTNRSLFEVLKAIHHYVASVIEVPNIAIAQADLSAQTLTLNYFIDEKDGSEYQGRTISIKDGLSSYVLGKGSPTLLSKNDILQLQQDGQIGSIHGSLCTSWIGVPIKHESETLGIIIVQSYNDNVLYDERDLEILAFVASNISTLLKQRQLSERELASKKALEDSLNIITEKNNEIETTLSKLKDAQHELIQKEKMASLGGLVAGIAHEINTPLGICVTGITTLEFQRKQFMAKVNTGSVSDQDFHNFMEDIQENCELIKNNSERAANLISGFKQIAVDQSSESEREINLDTYLKELVLSLNPLFKKTNHTIEIKCHQNIVVHTQPGAISQVFTNLIT
ncbi:MAG: GAF domain-containing protein, partial [Gammaproteobacteria bacterium]|nr:GAF domain-containing protein [Gammaproteobacteria bacterium]